MAKCNHLKPQLLLQQTNTLLYTSLILTMKTESGFHKRNAKINNDIFFYYVLSVLTGWVEK